MKNHSIETIRDIECFVFPEVTIEGYNFRLIAYKKKNDCAVFPDTITNQCSYQYKEVGEEKYSDDNIVGFFESDMEIEQLGFTEQEMLDFLKANQEQ